MWHQIGVFNEHSGACQQGVRIVGHKPGIAGHPAGELRQGFLGQLGRPCRPPPCSRSSNGAFHASSTTSRSYSVAWSPTKNPCGLSTPSWSSDGCADAPDAAPATAKSGLLSAMASAFSEYPALPLLHADTRPLSWHSESCISVQNTDGFEALGLLPGRFRYWLGSRSRIEYWL